MGARGPERSCIVDPSSHKTLSLKWVVTARGFFDGSVAGLSAGKRWASEANQTALGQSSSGAGSEEAGATAACTAAACATAACAAAARDSAMALAVREATHMRNVHWILRAAAHLALAWSLAS